MRLVSYMRHNSSSLTSASSAITPQSMTVYFLSLLSQSQVLFCCGVLRLTLIVRFCSWLYLCYI